MIDGDTLVVGAHYDQPSGNGSHTQPGAAYVFTRSGTTWSQQAKLVASDPEAGDRFGSAAAVSGDTIVIGAKLEDAVASALLVLHMSLLALVLHGLNKRN